MRSRSGPRAGATRAVSVFVLCTVSETRADLAECRPAMFTLYVDQSAGTKSTEEAAFIARLPYLERRALKIDQQSDSFSQATPAA